MAKFKFTGGAQFATELFVLGAHEHCWLFRGLALNCRELLGSSNARRVVGRHEIPSMSGHVRFGAFHQDAQRLESQVFLFLAVS